ncbi:hypothetical protein [Streptomyces sp. NPDC029704]|uniref:hypothetical protein n=1 Tax=Streptomyces sp. NPDC029704 TaxID=3156920 RepID=UPI0033CC0238
MTAPTSSLHPTAPAPAAIAQDPAPPPAPADPVKALLARHHALCARAVEPLEIAAGLEAHGIDDRQAAEYRHRDVFSLAEELHARVERTDDDPPPAPAPAPHTPARPYATCAAVRGRGTVPVALLCLWLVAYGLLGDWLVTALLHGRRALGGPTLLSSAAHAAAPTALALACATVPAALTAHWFAGHARRALDDRDLAGFARRARPALLLAATAFLAALLAFWWPARTGLPAGPPQTTGPLAGAALAGLGTLLYLALLLTAHGLTRPATTALLAAALAEALALASLLAARLPGCEALRWPVAWAATAHGPAAVPLLACVPTALALLGHAVPALSRASVHGRRPHPRHPAAATPPRATGGRPGDPPPCLRRPTKMTPQTGTAATVSRTERGHDR